MLKRKIVIFAFVLLSSQTALGRPVSYPGGWTFMEMHNRANTSVHLHYSPSASYSIGLRGVHARYEDAFAGLFQVNLLLKRFNGLESQANLYFNWGAGGAVDNDKIRPAGLAGFAAYWETRRLFVSYKNRVNTLGPEENSFTQSARVGIAPYIADFGSLHTWLMLEAAHYPGTDYENETEITPLVRFFKGPLLFEAGWSISGKLTLNFIRRF